MTNNFHTSLYTAPLVFLAVLLLFSATSSTSHAAGQNLIQNPTLETEAASGLPTGWNKGGYGVNARSLSYPVTGHGSAKAVRVEIGSYTSGDAKWYFSPVKVEPLKALEFSDFYRSNTTSFVTAQITLSDGTNRYVDLGRLNPSDAWTEFTTFFTPPANAVSVTVFHLIKSTGFLETDDYFMGTAAATSIQNASLESEASPGMPTAWNKGGYGINSRAHIYPVTGHQSAKAVRVEIGSYTSGDAKWYFSPVTVAPLKALEFSDFYRSNTTSFVTAQITLSDGTNRYIDLGKLNPTDTWTKFTAFLTPPTDAVSVTVFHLIKSAGFLETDDYSLGARTSDPTHFDKGYVSLMFDDGKIDTYRNAFPILDAAGFKSDTFIVTERLRENDFPGYVKPADVLAMQRAGHEIGAHTRTHANLTLLSAAEAEAEAVGSRQDLLAIGASPVNYFAFPFGAYNTTLKNMIKSNGFLGARSSDGGYNLKTTDRYALKRLPMVNTTTFADVKTYIDTARAEKTWAILLFHDVDNSGHTYAVTPALFQQIVDYLKQLGESPITIKTGISLMNQ